jgi:hypothetical protein
VVDISKVYPLLKIRASNLIQGLSHVNCRADCTKKKVMLLVRRSKRALFKIFAFSQLRFFLDAHILISDFVCNSKRKCVV